jgi:hypothetical protein
VNYVPMWFIKNQCQCQYIHYFQKKDKIMSHFASQKD